MQTYGKLELKYNEIVISIPEISSTKAHGSFYNVMQDN
jgi:hypothetical protein